MVDKIYNILNSLKEKNPLIHCITNPISINQCANALLSVGARPIMAEHPAEVCQITDTGKALMINLGNITQVRMKSIKLSLVKANSKSIPALMDVVGVACSNLRRKYVYDLLKTAHPSVIKGNYSEITALHDKDYFSSGIDAQGCLDVSFVSQKCRSLACKYNAVILATGKTDIVTDGQNTLYVKNGTEQLAKVTGTGCMLGSLCTGFMAVSKPLDAVVSACCYFGICGELAKTDRGNGTFMINLMDRISTVGKEEIKTYCNIEEQ